MSDHTDHTDEYDDDRVRYLTTGNIREEIVYAVGGDPTRHVAGAYDGMKKADVFRIATQLQPADSEIDIRECTLGTLYELVCKWAGGEYRPNAGRQWRIDRENLKRIHRAVGASDPREIPVFADGGLVTDPEGGGEYNCEACGVGLTREEYVAVGPSTPAAIYLGIDGQLGERDHHVVCDDCFEGAADDIWAGDRDE